MILIIHHLIQQLLTNQIIKFNNINFKKNKKFKVDLSPLVRFKKNKNLNSSN
jgi:hypothetical protein